MINPEYLKKEKIKELHESFLNSKPWNYVVLDNFLTDEVANKLYENFPTPSTLNVKRKSINENKAEEYHLERFHPVFGELRDFLNNKATYQWMSEVTGVDGLLSSYDSLGSGVHQGTNGSFVDVHVDINMNPEKNLHRRFNVLIYLNKHWKDEYGGALEVWDEKVERCYNKVYPNFNRALIMITDDKSYHGYSKINVPEGETRKSFYCYYYTPAEKDFEYRDSRFRSRPDEATAKKLITDVKETVKISTKRMLKRLGLKSLDFQDKNKKK